ncbi:glycosyltransferase family 2 protein [Lactococcus lactis]|uniref:glycosyltransferase family 2 protein n=1 Tax=Lactococcus lactis TaxID=1358 RepID=UPI00288FC8FC|nr:glycosyltransferase [Lactococcus lactis]MDT2926297.1 glycosyltransferase [Lactococcus lactis]
MISVIIPTYNREKTIERAIKSVINQENDLNNKYDLEIIIVDDCSSDNTLKVVKSMDNDSIKIIALESNVGANNARNIGIKYANGDYIAFQDSDDEWIPGKLNKQLSIFKQTNSDLVFTNFIRKNEFQKTEGKLTSKVKSGFISFDYFSTNPLMSTQTILVKKEVIKDNLFLEGLPRLQDWELSLRLSKLGYNCFFLEDILVNQYVQSNSISNNGYAAEQAIEIISNEFKEQFQNKKVRIHAYRLLAESTSDENKKKHFYNEILKISFDFKLFIKLKLIKLGSRGNK